MYRFSKRCATGFISQWIPLKPGRKMNNSNFSFGKENECIIAEMEERREGVYGDGYIL
jgi:hypothetical protein